MKAEDAGLCPYCGRGLSVSASEDTQAVLHALPVCKEFNKTDPLTFIKRVNDQRQKDEIGRAK